MLPIKRKFFSAIWRLKQGTVKCYYRAIKYLVEVLTEKHWLLDYLPTLTKKKEGVLLIRLDLIGDFVLWLDSAQAYRRIYPHQKITLAVNSACVDLAKALPHWDEVLSIDVAALRENYNYRLLILLKLRWRNFEVAIQPTFSREFVGDLVLRSSFAQERIGYAGDANNITISLKTKTDSWYTTLVPNHPLQIMELNINAHFVRKLGCADFLSCTPNVPPLGTRLDTQQVNSSYIVVAPGASWQPKRWPVHNFAQVIRKLVAQFKVQIVLCGGKSDQPVCAELSELLSSLQIIDLSGKTSLTELVEIIRGAKLVLTNDSAPIHLSAATRTPSVCILGGGHFKRFLPYQTEQHSNSTLPTVIYQEIACYGCRWKCIYPVDGSQAVPCITSIHIAAVYAACVQHLSHNPAGPYYLASTTTEAL